MNLRDMRTLLIAAGVFAVAMPALLLSRHPKPHTVPAPVSPLRAPAFDAPQALFERPVFGAAPAAEEAPPPADAPALVGIVGRLDRDAVALVRTQAGTTRTLKIGESVDGWTLASLALDAAYFTRGAQRVRVPLPAG